MERVADHHRDAKRIVVIWDNLNIHYDWTRGRCTAFNERHGGKFQFFYTPLHASWVNQVEIFFSILHRCCLRHGDFRSEAELRDHLLAFIARWHQTEGRPFHWTFRGYPIQEALGCTEVDQTTPKRLDRHCPVSLGSYVFGTGQNQ